MNYNEALLKNALLADLREVKNLPAKAMTEVLLLRVHYGKIAESYYAEVKKINEDADANDEAKAKAVEEKVKEEVTTPEKRMSKDAFEQIVESAMAHQTIKSWIVVNPEAEGDERRGEIPTEQWLMNFAGNLVENY